MTMVPPAKPGSGGRISAWVGTANEGLSSPFGHGLAEQDPAHYGAAEPSGLASMLIYPERRVGFYLRKSIKAGPFRFNLSKSGVGVSAGVKGFRVGTGPRGNYVHVGRNGVYYRSSLSSRSSSGNAHSGEPSHLDTGLPMESLAGAETVALAASSSSDLLRQIEEAQRRLLIWPWALGAVLLLANLASGVAGWFGTVVLILGAIGVGWLWLRDTARKSVVVFFEVDDAPAARFSALVDAHTAASKSKKIWHMNSAARLSDLQTRKRNAGAGHLVNREEVSTSNRGPKVLKTNIAIPSFTSKSRSIFWLPDRVLVLQKGKFADIPWSDVHAGFNYSRFIEDGRVPSDADVVDRTWRYVNKGGGPDKRYKDNKQLPVCRYGDLILTADNGFRVEWQFSAADAPKPMVIAIDQVKVDFPG